MLVIGHTVSSAGVVVLSVAEVVVHGYVHDDEHWLTTMVLVVKVTTMVSVAEVALSEVQVVVHGCHLASLYKSWFFEKPAYVRF